MTQKWAKFEDRVRAIAQYIWGRPCKPGRIGGVNIDAVVSLGPEILNLIEITEERNLQKVREDIIKLQTAKAAALTEGKLARCFCVLNGHVTEAMHDAAKPHHIQIVSIDEFTKQFFAFDEYQHARVNAPFGSAVDPLTGESDQTEYVPVRYIVDGRKSDASSEDLADWIRSGRTIILMGEYGTGKSRCIREVFRHLSREADSAFCYPVAVDLRRSWGLSSYDEVLRRHFRLLGLDHMEPAAVRAFRSGALAILLDGFDEIGSQAWSNDVRRLKAIRAKSLEGVKDLISNNRGRILITGREHYFQSNDEMFQALGLSATDTIVARVKNEFSDSELLEYFSGRDIEADIPDWLPRRPLICQTISTLASDQLDAMFGEEGDEVAFWNHFIRVLCERDARIHVSFDPDTIFRMFLHLARLTRTKSADVGPISLVELQSAFEAATGSAPVEEASVMLQRLPSLGRISPESNDRQFVDVYILDGLRAKDIVSACLGSEAEFLTIAGAKWINALDDLGQRILSQDTSMNDRSRLAFAKRSLENGNKVLASDFVAALTRSHSDAMDFKGLVLNGGDFRYLTFSERQVENLQILNSYIGELALPAKRASNVSINDCVALRVTGVTSPAGLPTWIKKLEADKFDSVESISRIRRIGLQPSHEILIAIIRKTFFQKGSGRKEEALLRGLGKPATKSLANRILNLLVREGLLTTFRGNEGDVYAPVRSQTNRMQELLNQLKASTDPIWTKVGEM